MKSNVNLYLSEGATLKFSTDPAKYLPVVLTRFEGTECMNFSPFIYAFEQENIAITGTGLLDGWASNENWWRWARRAADDADSPARPDIRRLLDFGQRGAPVAERIFGQDHRLRPNFIQPYRCRNLLVEGNNDSQLADVGDSSRAQQQCHRSRRKDFQPRTKQ